MLITAVVVTYDRKQLLLKCLRALKNQSRRPDRILIVDNASTDDTVGCLGSAGWLDDPCVELFVLKKNLGGAGGFAEGMRHALKRGAEGLWLMDDDGHPANDSLEMLLETLENRQLDAVSPMQIDIDDPTLPAFPVYDHSGRLIKRLPFAPGNGDPFIPGMANLFNGLLIRAVAIQKIGFPRAELFIRGDEVDYAYRMSRQGVKFGTLSSAGFYHPSDRNERVRILFGLAQARDAGSPFKNYYMFRNKALAYREKGRLWLVPLDFVRNAYYFLFVRKLDFSGLSLWIEASGDGLKKKLGRHPSY
jgi:rhamnopyranosyl-N-acetylglucosaminyl-diphospho-decaprenol beta-1,3/1,4-galactofuranosyltransferase